MITKKNDSSNESAVVKCRFQTRECPGHFRKEFNYHDFIESKTMRLYYSGLWCEGYHFITHKSGEIEQLYPDPPAPQ